MKETLTALLCCNLGLELQNIYYFGHEKICSLFPVIYVIYTLCLIRCIQALQHDGNVSQSQYILSIKMHKVVTECKEQTIFLLASISFCV